MGALIPGNNPDARTVAHSDEEGPMSDWNTGIIEEFRTNEGRVGGMFEGAPILLLHTKCRRSGQERVNPLMYLLDRRDDGDRYVVFASKGGHPSHPHWLLNVEHDPEVEIEVGTERFPARATVLRDGPERDDLYERQVALRPQFGEYAVKTEGIRTIPVVVLERVGDRG
jgi:deazaflavin-dependent oxidoreductase (nitroreductase family)